MNHLNIFFAFVTFLFWLALIVVYKREALRDWYQNRFVPDKPPIRQEEQNEEEKEPLLPFDYEIPKSKFYEKPPIEAFYENDAYQLIAFNSAKKSDYLLIFMPDYGLICSWEEKFYRDFFLKKITELNIISLAFIPQKEAVEELKTYDFHLKKAYERAREWFFDYRRRMLKNKDLKIILLGNSLEFYKIILKESQILTHIYDAAFALPPSCEEGGDKISSLRGNNQEREEEPPPLFLEYDPRDIREERFYLHIFKDLTRIYKRDYVALPLCYQHPYKQDEGWRKSDFFFNNLEYLESFLRHYDENSVLFQEFVKKRRHKRDVLLHILLRAFEKKRFSLVVRTLRSKRFKEMEVIAFMKERDSARLRHIVKILIEENYTEQLGFLIEELNLPHFKEPL